MMNLYQHVKDLFISDPTSTDSKETLHEGGDRPCLKTQAETSTCTNGLVAASRRKEQRRYFTGTVTSVSGDSGMIDNHVYFDWDCIVGGQKPIVGGAAHVTATREHVQAGWKAVRVDLMSEWRPEEDSETEVVVGVVTGMSRTKCVVESGGRDVTFEPRQTSSGYRPQIGDDVEVC